MAKWLVVLVCFSVSSFADTPVIVYPYQVLGDDYPIELLKLALNKNAGQESFRVQESSMQITQGRSLLMLSQGKGIDVAWSMTSNEREELLTAIKIPIYKGLFGYRLFLIHNSQQSRFPASMTAADLQQNRIAVQGVDWPDIGILRHNQFKVISATNFSAMFELVSKKRVDYFPRSILEIWGEENVFTKGQLIVEQNFALSYPTYVYYFVAKDNHTLAQRLRVGILSSIEDGSFDSLFNQYKGTSLEKADLKNRKIFHLENPNVNTKGVYQWPSMSNE